MKIDSFYDAVALHRLEKALVARLLVPHRVLSTCRFNGGLRDDIEYVYNHQSCEPSNHIGTDLCDVAVGDPERYQRRICGKAGIPHENSVSLGTAANMNNAAIARASDGALLVAVVATAGVGSNGGRAGDPASYRQTLNGPQSVKAAREAKPVGGTINIMVFASEEIAPGAMVAAATVIAEAKASVLQELSAPSRYSDGIATGTGTDQIAIASLLGTPLRHTDANKHCKLGELLGVSVRSALQQALNLQSGMTPDARRSCVALLQRFGETQASFIAGVRELLPARSQALFEYNFLSVNHDPLTVAALQALVHLRDQFAWKVLPTSCWPEVAVGYAAQLASAVSGKGLGHAAFREEIAVLGHPTDAQGLLQLARQAVAFGFARKWEGRFED